MAAAVDTRRAAILDILRREGFANSAQLCGELGCSPATLRRDLEQLEQEGRLRRTHGGAVLDGEREVPFALKLGAMAREKQRIARAAAELVQPGQAVGLTGGTTTQQLARSLSSKQSLTVVTNALTVAMELARSEVRVIVTGGELRGSTYELVGPLAEPVLEQIHLDLVFLGVDGLSVERGATTYHPTEARINRTLIERAGQVVVVTDHSKLGRKTLAQMAPIDSVHTLITDSDADAGEIVRLAERGIQIIQV